MVPWLRKSWIGSRTGRHGSSVRAELTSDRQVDDEKLWYLQRINIFSDLTEADMHRLAERTEMRRYARGKVIVHPGDPSDTIYLVKEGCVRLCYRSADGREQTLALLGHGDIFGEYGLAGIAADIHCEAFEDTLICVLRRRHFEDLLKEKPQLAMRVIRQLAKRLQQAEETIESLGLQDVPGRLAALLLRLADAYGEPHEVGQRLALRLTHQDLATMIGSTRETVTSVLNRFRDEGLIAVEERFIIIHDPSRLGAQ